MAAFDPRDGLDPNNPVVFPWYWGELILRVRAIIKDDNIQVGYRHPDEYFIGCANEAMSALSTIRPELFETVSPMITQEGSFQNMDSSDPTINRVAVPTLKFQGVDRNFNGIAMTPFDKDLLDHFNPLWTIGDKAFFPRQWAPHETMPQAFWLYPPAAAGTAIYVRHVKQPNKIRLDTGMNETIEVPNSYRSALMNYMIYREQSSDDEHVIQQRAIMFFQQFLSEAGVASKLPSPGVATPAMGA